MVVSVRLAVLVMTAGLLMGQAGFGATQAPAVSQANGQGPMTRSGNKAWQVLSFPLRLVTGGAGLALGAIGGGMRGVVNTEEQFAQDTFGAADQNPLMVPVGLLGTIAAVPVGLAKGAPGGAASGGDYGFHLWDKF